MKILSEISFQEMCRRWAIGECDSERFPSPLSADEKLALKSTSNPTLINKQLSIRPDYIRGFKETIKKWYLVSFPIIESEFKNLRTPSSWESHSDGTGLFYIAANNLINHKRIDTEVDTIITEFPKGKVGLMGITLVSEKNDGSYRIVEGTARMVAIYRYYIINKQRFDFISDNTIEVVLGLINPGAVC